MDSDFDLESLVHLEQTFYDRGFKDGFTHGEIHGLIEGRALGREKGFEMWEELGFYEGFAKGWKAILASSLLGTDSNHPRAIQHIHHLLELIDQFPRVNPSSSSTLQGNNETNIDIQKLQRQIRSRYKALCSSLGVRPRMPVVSESVTSAASDDQDMNTDGSQRDHRAIPVWKIDQASGVRSKVTNMDLSY